jgi:hypothetical protein
MSDVATDRLVVLAPCRKTSVSRVTDTTVAICFLVPNTGAVIRTRDPASTRFSAGADIWENPATGVISATAHSVDMNRITAPVLRPRDGEDAFACGSWSNNYVVPRTARVIRQLT